MAEKSFTHLNERGDAHMVDVTAKVSAAAEKLAEGLRSMFGVGLGGKK